jgi:hypothetical protein
MKNTIKPNPSPNKNKIIGKKYLYIAPRVQESFEFKIFGEHGDFYDIVVQENGPQLFKIKKSELQYCKEL